MTSTVRVFNPSGNGYSDITTNDQAIVIRETHYGDDNVVKETVERDPESGETQTTSYENGKKKTRISRNRDGEDTKQEDYDEQGRLIREEVIENFISDVVEFSYDREGRIHLVQKFNDGHMDESVQFFYDRDGKLESVSRDEFDENNTSTYSGLEFDDKGEIASSQGDVERLIKLINRLLQREYPNIDGHLSVDHLGNKTLVRHNKDGSYDVSVTDSENRLVLREYYQSGRCYIGDECPFRY